MKKRYVGLLDTSPICRPCEMTPDKLRGLAQEALTESWTYDSVIAACVAWEADIAHIEALENACEIALYLLGNDQDRRRLGDVPWKPQGITSIPDILRAALAKEKP